MKKYHEVSDIHFTDEILKIKIDGFLGIEHSPQKIKGFANVAQKKQPAFCNRPRSG
jgi:hypothetical protein